MTTRWLGWALALTMAAGCGDDSSTGGAGGAGASGAGASGAGGSGASGAAGGEGGAGGDGGAGATGGAGGEGGAGGAALCAEPAAAYDGQEYTTNAATQLALRTQLGAINTAMRAAELDLAVTPTAAELLGLYEAGSPSVRDETTATYDAYVLDLFDGFEAAAGNVWVPVAPPTGPGGRFGAFIYSADGIDLRQGVEKGLFEAAFYNHAWKIRTGATFGLAELDQLLAIYGAHPTFPGDSETTDTMLVPFPDRVGAQYAERRSPKAIGDTTQPLDSANPGPYFRIKAQFLSAQAAIAAGAACDGQRDAALDAILAEWERAIFATVVYYLNDAFVKLTSDNPTEATLSAGLHGYGEAIAFVAGWKGLPADSRVVTDAEIDALLETLGSPLGGPSTAYELLTDSATAAPKLIDAIDEIAAIYAFSDPEIEAFKVNH
jgi:hypothetical protein